MTPNHECDNDTDESCTSIDMPKSDNDTCVTLAPVPTIPPDSSPNHPPERPKAAPPDPWSTKSPNLSWNDHYAALLAAHFNNDPESTQT